MSSFYSVSVSQPIECDRCRLCQAVLDYYDRWEEETRQRASETMRSKHNELDEEMQLQMSLHEPRRARIENDIHRVRAGESDQF